MQSIGRACALHRQGSRFYPCLVSPVKRFASAKKLPRTLLSIRVFKVLKWKVMRARPWRADALRSWQAVLTYCSDFVEGSLLGPCYLSPLVHPTGFLDVFKMQAKTEGTSPAGMGARAFKWGEGCVEMEELSPLVLEYQTPSSPPPPAAFPLSHLQSPMVYLFPQTNAIPAFLITSFQLFIYCLSPCFQAPSHCQAADCVSCPYNLSSYFTGTM